MEQKNRFLSLGIALGLIAGTAVGVLVDLFTGWTFSISMGAGLGMLGGIVLGALLDQQPPAPGIFRRTAGPEIPLKKVRLLSAHILVLSIE